MTDFATIAWNGRPVQIEHRWIGTESSGTAHGTRSAQGPLIIFLHEGLGSVSMWRDFPDRLCAAVNARGLVYSRPGYGQSTPRAADEAWGVDFMHRQAHDVLPALLAALDIDAKRERPVLLGHSDGGSIALLYAARWPGQVRALVALAPHILVEDVSVRSIEQVRTAYQDTDLKQRLSRHHQDPDSAFWGWNNIWLHPPFRQWTIEQEIGSIACPLLAIQGLDDEYGSLEQIRGINRRLPQTRLLELPACGHSPHRDQPEAVIQAVASLL